MSARNDLITGLEHQAVSPLRTEEKRAPARWRHARVERLRQRIQRGEYDIDPQLVAGAMIEYLRAARTR